MEKAGIYCLVGKQFQVGRLNSLEMNGGDGCPTIRM